MTFSATSKTLDKSHNIKNTRHSACEHYMVSVVMLSITLSSDMLSVVVLNVVAHVGDEVKTFL